MRPSLAALGGVVALVIATFGCGGGGGGGSGGGSGGGPAAGAFEVVRADPAHGSQPSAVARIRLVFNGDVDPLSVLFDLANLPASTLLIVAQAPGSSTVSPVPGQIAINGAEIVFTPQAGLSGGFRYGVALTSGIRDVAGAALTTGGVSGPLTLSVPGLVFQSVFTFTPGSGGTTGGGTTSGGGTTTGGTTTGGSTGGTSTPAALLASFVAEPSSDVWYIDFVTAGTFSNDLRNRGLGSGNATIDLWAKNRVIQKVLGYTGTKYFRNANGTGASGRSFAISFVATAPTGQPGRDFNRHCVGGYGGSTLGESFYDPGNRDYEDNSPANGCGIYSSSIDGTDSRLSPGLRTTEQRFVDGTYQLGAGTTTDDARFRAVSESLLDYGTAIGCVLAHEVGHSVGLDHDNGGSTSIMSAALSEPMLSNPNMRFIQSQLNLLLNNLGYTR